MDRREASLILGIRESAGEEKVRDAHRRIMIANHPDSGARIGRAGALMGGTASSAGGVAGVGGEAFEGSSRSSAARTRSPTHPANTSPPHPTTHTHPGGSGFIAAKVNEAKDKLLGKAKTGGSVF
jgi:hypothetical protein